MTIRVREAERKFLRWAWWVFPAAGLVVAMLTGGGFWAWVDGEMPWLDWRQALTARGAVLAVAGLVAVGVWRVLLRKTWSGWGVALVVAAGFAAAEVVVRVPVVQTAFWLAVRARHDPLHGWFTSDTCYVRLEEAAGRQGTEPAVIVSGTSQVTCGVDIHELGRMLAPTVVIRRAISGMGPQNMLAAWAWFPFRNGDCCVQMRSEMDFTNQAEWRTSWYRPFLTWRTLPWLMRAVGAPICLRHWDELPDCAAAATLEGWRMRDGWREIVFHPWRRVLEKVESEDKTAVPAELPALEWVEGEWLAFVAGAERMKEAGVELVVVEGDVNPVLHNPQRTQMRKEFERRMVEGAEKGLWRFVGEEELNAEIAADEWADMTHVNTAGREKLTRAIGRVLEAGGMTETAMGRSAGKPPPKGTALSRRGPALPSDGGSGVATTGTEGADGLDGERGGSVVGGE